VFGMDEEEDLAKNSRHHRLKLIILHSQARIEIQTGIYNPHM